MNTTSIACGHSYYPFGLEMKGISSKALSFGGAENKKKYVGNELQNKEFSDGSGLELYDFNARTYDQQIGRFIQIDPMTDEGGQESWSPYHYSYNNPTTYSDPDGEIPIPIIWAIVAAITSDAAVVTVTAATATVVTMKVVEDVQNSDISLRATGTGNARPAMGGSAAQMDAAIERQIRSNSTPPAVKKGIKLGNTASSAGEAAKSLAKNSKAGQTTSALPKLPKGKGSVPPSQRDPKRVYTKKEKAEMLEKQDGKCAGCGQEKKLEEVQGHHKNTRHADGGRTNASNGAAVCVDCHVKAHTQQK